MKALRRRVYNQTMNTIVGWIVNGIAVFITAKLLPGVVLKDLSTALIVAVVLGIINTFLKPILQILTLPITILTLGLFSFILNALLILLVSKIVPGFQISGLLTALLFGIVLSIISGILNAIV